jgi:hypothetical protein
VGGISDSPQSLACYMQTPRGLERLDLSCQQGNYMIRWDNEAHLITNAYHEDVVDGPSPLIFEADKLKMTSLSYTIYTRTTIEVPGQTYEGLCFTF